MENRYYKVMKNIEVTAEMRDRILNNINNFDLDKTPNKVVPFRNYKKYFSIAACFVILLVGSVILHNIINLHNEPPYQEDLGEKGIVDHSTVGELSEAVGFTVKEIQDISFDVEAVRYTSFWCELAEIEYADKNNTVVFRMAPRNEDVSGDYSEYASIENRRINDYDVTIKGNDDKYSLAVWKHDGFSYSISITNGISEIDLLKMVQSVK